MKKYSKIRKKWKRRPRKVSFNNSRKSLLRNNAAINFCVQTFLIWRPYDRVTLDSLKLSWKTKDCLPVPVLLLLGDKGKVEEKHTTFSCSYSSSLMTLEAHNSKFGMRALQDARDRRHIWLPQEPTWWWYGLGPLWLRLRLRVRVWVWVWVWLCAAHAYEIESESEIARGREGGGRGVELATASAVSSITLYSKSITQ